MQLGLAEPRIDFAPFERRLSTNDAAPVAIALSGGGDSLALLLAAERWAARAGRRLLALTVDHGLQPDGARWAHWAGQRARRLGIQHRTLHWDGDKPVAGLPAAYTALRPVDVPAGRAPSMIDEYPILAVACAGFGRGPPAGTGRRGRLGRG